jgi:hypothetical protein
MGHAGRGLPRSGIAHARPGSARHPPVARLRPEPGRGLRLGRRAHLRRPGADPPRCRRGAPPHGLRRGPRRRRQTRARGIVDDASERRGRDGRMVERGRLGIVERSSAWSTPARCPAHGEGCLHCRRQGCGARGSRHGAVLRAHCAEAAAYHCGRRARGAGRGETGALPRVRGDRDRRPSRLYERTAVPRGHENPLRRHSGHAGGAAFGAGYLLRHRDPRPPARRRRAGGLHQQALRLHRHDRQPAQGPAHPQAAH